MGIFKFLIKLNNDFFEGLKRNAINNAIENSKKTNRKKISKTPKNKGAHAAIDRLGQLDKMVRQSEKDLKELDPD